MYTGKTDVKLDLLRLLTLVTKLQRHLAFCIRHSEKHPAAAHETACKSCYDNLCMFGTWKLSSAAESKPFQSRSTAEIPGLAKREEPEERRSRSKFKYTFLIDSDAELLMYYLIPCIRFGSMKSSASEQWQLPPNWVKHYKNCIAKCFYSYIDHFPEIWGKNTNSPLTVDVRLSLSSLSFHPSHCLKLPVVSGIQVKWKWNWWNIKSCHMCLVDRFVCLAAKYIYNYVDKAPFAQASQDNS